MTSEERHMLIAQCIFENIKQVKDQSTRKYLTLYADKIVFGTYQIREAQKLNIALGCQCPTCFLLVLQLPPGDYQQHVLEQYVLHTVGSVCSST